MTEECLEVGLCRAEQVLGLKEMSLALKSMARAVGYLTHHSRSFTQKRPPKGPDNISDNGDELQLNACGGNVARRARRREGRWPSVQKG